MAMMYGDEEHRRRQNQAARRSKQESKASFVNDYKRSLRCKTCRENEPACLDMHHLDPNTKDITISEALRVWSLERIWSEMQKCIVLCSNCHRKLHAGVISIPDY